jgi:CBS domain-containing protein
MQVRDGMSKVVLSVGPGHTLRDAARSMADRHVGAAVVMDPTARAAIITERDVLVSIGRGEDPDTERVGDHLTRRRLRLARVAARARAGEMVRGSFATSSCSRAATSSACCRFATSCAAGPTTERHATSRGRGGRLGLDASTVDGRRNAASGGGFWGSGDRVPDDRRVLERQVPVLVDGRRGSRRPGPRRSGSGRRYEQKADRHAQQGHGDADGQRGAAARSRRDVDLLAGGRDGSVEAGSSTACRGRPRGRTSRT